MKTIIYQKYNNIRALFSSGDLIFWSGKSLFSKIIRWWTKSSYTHVGIIWEIGDRYFILESMDGIGVRIYPLSRRRPFYFIKTKVKWTKELESIALKHVGDKYSWIGCLKAGLGIVTKRDRYWQCAEFVSYIYENSNIILNINTETPEKLINAFVSNNPTITCVD